MLSRKTLAICLVAVLVAGSLALPAEAKKKKKKKKPKPVATTLFLDGESTFGEEDQTGTGSFLKLVPEAGDGEKSMGMPQFAVTPNMQCAGNSLWPVFVGSISGQVVGDMKVSFNAFGQGGSVEVRVWPDVGSQACNESFIEPAGAVVVDMPVGEGLVEATIEGLDFTAQSLMMIQLTPVVQAPPYYGRAFYGTEESKTEFDCIPPKGEEACISEE